MDISNIIYQKYDLSQQAIIMPSENIRCLYYEKWGSVFLYEIFKECIDWLPENTTFLFSNGYRSNLPAENFREMSKSSIYSIEDLEIQGLGIILTDKSFSWLIHRDPDYGTISFAYDDKISIDIINKLKDSKYYMDDRPRVEFYTDEI